MSTDTAACAYINGTVKSRLSKDKQWQVIYDLSIKSNGVISSDLEWPIIWVSRSLYFSKANNIQTGAFYIVQLPIKMYLLNLQYNVLLMCRRHSAIAEPLVSLFYFLVACSRLRCTLSSWPHVTLSHHVV